MNFRKVMDNVVYYSIIAIMVTFVVFFFITLVNVNMAGWEKVCYYILTVELVCSVIYDVLCTMFFQNQKTISGIIMYAITMMGIILSLIVCAVNSDAGRLFTDISEVIFRLITIGYLINAMAILVYYSGKKYIKDFPIKNKN